MAKVANQEEKQEAAETVEGSEQDIRGGEVAADVDGDGVPDLDPEAVEVTLRDLVTLDHALRDHGATLADLLRHVAASSRGIFV